MGLLGAWAVSYVRGCWIAVLAPGVPVSLQLSTKGGPVTFAADSYAFNPRAGFLQLEAPSLTDASGAKIASASSLQASGIDVLDPSQSALTITASHLVGTLTRDPNGRFEFQRYLPTPGKQTAPIPVEVRINDASLTVVDQAGAQPWRRHVALDNVRFAGVGSKWLAAARATIEGVGVAQTSVRHEQDGDIDVFVSGSQLQLADLGRHIVSTLPSNQRPKESVSAQSLVASGPVEFQSGPTEGVRFHFYGGVEGRDLAYGAYRAGTAHLVGTIGRDGIDGKLALEGPGAKLAMNGAVAWSGAASAAGSLTVSVASLNSLPSQIRAMLPKNVAASALGFTGVAGYDPNRGLYADGRLTVGKASFEKDVAMNIQARIVADRSRAWGHLDRASSMGAKLAGEGVIDIPKQTISAYLRVSDMTASALLRRFPDIEKRAPGTVTGSLDATAVVTGVVKEPKLDFRIAGQGAYAARNLEKPLAVPRVLALGEYANGILTLRRFRARMESGTVNAFGRLDVHTRTLALSVDSRGLDISQFTSKATGVASVEGQVVGTLDEPKFLGQVDGYDLAYNGASVAVATAKVEATPQQILASNFETVFGSSEIEGALSLDVKSKAIGGEVHSKGLQLGDLLGDDFAGLVQVDSTSVGGTYDEPKVTFAVSGKDLLARDTPLDSVTANASIDGKLVTLVKADAKVAGGSVSAQGKYDLDSGVGGFTGSGLNLELASIVPRTSSASAGLTVCDAPSQVKLSDQHVTGVTDGSFRVDLDNGALANVTATGRLKDLSINGAGFGDGPWSIEKTGEKWSGAITAKGAGGTLTLTNGAFDEATNALSADIDLHKVNLQNLYTSAQPWLASESEEAYSRLAFVEGAVDASAHVAGSLDDLDVSVPSLAASGIKYAGVDFGSIVASGSRAKGLWTIDSLSLTDGPTLAHANGTVQEGGDARLDGEIDNFDISKLSVFIPEASRFAGSLSASFRASGPTKQPTVRASADIERVAVNGQRIDFGLDLDSILLSQGAIEASGGLSYRGFHGTVQGHLPFAFPGQIPSDQPISARLTLAERPLADLTPYVPNLDPDLTSGTLRGLIALTGYRDSLHLSGGISITAPQIGFRMSTPGKATFEPLKTKVRDLVASLDLADSVVSVDVAAKSSEGGAIDAQLGMTLAALGQVLSDHSVPDADAWLASAVKGKIGFDSVAVKERNSVFDTSFALSGMLNLLGTLGSPEIRSAGDDGALAISNLQTSLPSIGSQERVQTSPPSIDPELDVRFALKNPGHVSTSLAGIDLNGGGRISGTAWAPNIAANFAVVRGLLALPGGRVTLEPGGTVRANYTSDEAGAPEAHVLVDLLGDSHVVALRTLDSAERYDVHLDVRGDLLQPEQISLTAVSDPPDLTQDQILGMLGRTDLLQALGSGTSAAQGQKELTQAAIGYAIPSIFDPVTAKLAANLHLDALTVEYNFLGQTSILAAKSLGHGFLIEAQRQISEPAPGQQFTFDYRLIYRPPFRSIIGRRITFFLGADQQNTWKLGFQYGIRF